MEETMGTVITAESYTRARAIFDGLIEKAGELAADVGETVAEVARLEREAREREAKIEALHSELDQARARCLQLENRTSTLSDEVVRLESVVATQGAVLENFRQLAEQTKAA